MACILSMKQGGAGLTQHTFFWHDYETWGANPSVDRPSQFAGVRTDADLNVIGEPLMLYSRPTPDYLPHPEACLITGLTPQQVLEEGLPEAEFIARIHRELSQPGTCGVGYNSIRFDDEVTRFTLYRNFYDPYAREWQNGNSRWDLIDVVRLCRALRPEGIQWPEREDGTPSFKLELLTQANGLSHEAAHDALSDVHATIALAKLIRDRQPKLFEYALGLRFKHAVAAQLNLVTQAPVLHVSGRIPAARFCSALVMPLMAHPTNRNSVIVYDLATDPTPLLQGSVEDIQRLVFSRAAELEENDEARIPLKEIHINRAPVVATVKLVDDAVAARLQLDMAACRRHWQQLREAGEGLRGRLKQVFAARDFAEQTDPDSMLYSGGFFSDADRQLMNRLRETPPAELARQSFPFEDRRLPEMLWRYRARNYPETLSPQELADWRQFCAERLRDTDPARLSLTTFRERLNALAPDVGDDKGRFVLQELSEYADDLEAALQG